MAPTADLDAIRDALEDHPVRLAVVFGSQVRGTATSESDVDIAVEFEEGLSADERHRATLELVVDVMEELGVNDVDVTDLDGVPPAVGASALETGVVVLGDDERVEELWEQLDARRTVRSHAERMREFDELLARLEETV